MDNFLTGIVFFSFCIVLFFFIWQQYRNNRIYVALFLIIGLGFALRLFVCCDFYLHEWDERYHALVAKNLIEYPFQPMLYVNPVLPYDYTDWSGNHIWVHKQPIPLWTMALSLKAFGINELALRLPSLLISTLGIWLTFQIARNLFNEKIAIIAAFLHSVNGLIIELTGGRVTTDHIDVFFCFFIELGVLFALRAAQNKNTKQWLFLTLTGVAIGLAILTKWLPALIVLPVWFFLKKENKYTHFGTYFKEGIYILGIAIIIAAPWQIYIHQNFPLEAAWEQTYNTRHLFEGLEGHGQAFYFHLDKIRIIFGELMYIPLIWFFYHIIKKSKRVPSKYLALGVWVLLPLLFFSFAKTKMQAYTLFTAPAIFMVISLFIYYLQQNYKHFKYRWVAKILIVGLLLLPIRYCFERVKPFSQKERNPVWAEEFRQLGKTLENAEKTLIFKVERPIEAMFYTNATAYSYNPPKVVIDSLKRENYIIFIAKKQRKHQVFLKQ